ncbi:MAG TPA: orotidine-5'-phosphate decarboxylase [Elusimicrobiota bacterium]|nr:orotidine-5'-phosphate decarboxylase [Elusimicrobiota bacterium]
MKRKGKGLIVALDVDSPASARALVRRLGGSVDFYKIPPALSLRDPTLVPWLRRAGKKMFLDHKWYDIPSQMRRSVQAAGRAGVTSCTVHVSAGLAALRAAASLRPRPLLWGVSVLTSFTNRDLRDIGVGSSVPAQVCRLARLAEKAGLEGLICSPQELPLLKKTSLTLVTPGIRLGRASARDDQARSMTPREAWSNGARWIVVGRPILESGDPLAAVREILRERPC